LPSPSSPGWPSAAAATPATTRAHGRAERARRLWHGAAASPVAVVWHLSPGSGELFTAVGTARASFAAVSRSDRGCRSGGV
jgi:hypothetical protein